MPRTRTAKKLQDGDPGFDAGTTKFDVSVQNSTKVQTMTIADVDARIASYQAAKTKDAAIWDTKIANMEALKAELEAADV